jgi:hypothetical protein
LFAREISSNVVMLYGPIAQVVRALH